MENSPFRDGMVTISQYKEMENSLKKEINEKESRVSYLESSLNNQIRATNELDKELREEKKMGMYSAIGSLVKFVIVLGCLIWLVIYLVRCDNRQDPSGEVAFVNAENSLKKYMRGMNYTVNSMSCRAGQINNVANRCNDGFRFCQVSYHTQESQTPVNDYYCCDDAFPDISAGCSQNPVRDTSNRTNTTR